MTLRLAVVTTLKDNPKAKYWVKHLFNKHGRDYIKFMKTQTISGSYGVSSKFWTNWSVARSSKFCTNWSVARSPNHKCLVNVKDLMKTNLTTTLYTKVRPLFGVNTTGGRNMPTSASINGGGDSRRFSFWTIRASIHHSSQAKVPEDILISLDCLLGEPSLSVMLQMFLHIRVFHIYLFKTDVGGSNIISVPGQYKVNAKNLELNMINAHKAVIFRFRRFGYFLLCKMPKFYLKKSNIFKKILKLL